MFPWFLTEKRAPRFPYRDRIKESAQLKNSIFVQLKTEGCQSITLNCLQSWFPSKEQVKKYSNLYKLNLFSWRNFKINLVRSCSIVFFFLFFVCVFFFSLFFVCVVNVCNDVFHFVHSALDDYGILLKVIYFRHIFCDILLWWDLCFYLLC